MLMFHELKETHLSVGREASNDLLVQDFLGYGFEHFAKPSIF